MAVNPAINLASTKSAQTILDSKCPSDTVTVFYVETYDDQFVCTKEV